MKCCIIRRVPFKWPGSRLRIVWGNVLCESEGLALLLVPKRELDSPNSLFIAQENIEERVFEAVSSYRFELENEDLWKTGDKLRQLGKSLMLTEYRQHRDQDESRFD